jgi:hypothetical protein
LGIVELKVCDLLGIHPALMEQLYHCQFVVKRRTLFGSETKLLWNRGSAIPATFQTPVVEDSPAIWAIMFHSACRRLTIVI